MRKIRSFVFFIIALIFVFAFFIYLSEGKNLSLNKNEILKLSYDVLQAAEKNEEKIKVIVELEDSVIEKGKFGVSSVKNVDKNSFIMQNEKIRKKIKHTFIYSNAFSAELSPSEIEELAKKPEVKKIHYDYPVQAFLQQSVPLINASSSWNLEVDGINLTGGGQTICVIDTGVDYRHSDLGGCTKIFSNTSEEQNIGPLISPGYPNNYSNYEGNCINTHNISANGDGIEVYFEDLDIGEDDYLYLTNEQNEIYAYATNGSEQGAWSPLSITNKIKIFLCTNSSSGRGYNITKIRVYNFSSSCNKIIWGIDLYNLDFDPLDDNGHGTHVAGIAGANGTIKGVAPGSKILAVKALNSDGGGFSSDIIAGIEYCINKSEELNISVISMSLGANCNEYPQYCHNNYCDEDDSLTAQSINLAVSKNISVVIATSNNGNSNLISEPSCIYNSTRVGSTTKSDGVSSFSNRWALEMLMAPGSSINSTKINGDYTTMSGTSMATPHVSGAIAIIRQYLAITNRTMTPKEIEFLLNKTGKSISADGRTYKRIDLLSALLEIDVTPPKINVSGIENNTKTLERNLTFNYSVGDWQLANVTFYLFNSGGLYRNETKNLEGTFNQSFFYVENLTSDFYSWYINASDKKGNIATSEIGIFEIKEPIKMLPRNNTYTNTNQTFFNCSAFSKDYNLMNITIYLWNFSNEKELLKNQTFGVSGNENFSLMEYNFTEEGKYLWGCEVFNENNEKEFLNYTLTFDVTIPHLTKLEKSTTHNSATIKINTTEETNATIEIIGKETKTNSSFSFEKTFYFEGLSASTIYNFNLTFCDEAGNCNNSEESFITSAAPSSGGGGGGGGGKKEIFITSTELTKGITKEISVGEEIKFQKSGQNHTLKINKILNNSTNITIRSEPINFIIFVSEEKKFNLTSNEFYDLYIKLNEIKNNKANLTIKEIDERIIFHNESKINQKTEEKINNIIEDNKTKNNFFKRSGDYKSFFMVFLAVLFLFLIILVIKIFLRISFLFKHDKKSKG